jgi:hypothetical protein
VDPVEFLTRHRSLDVQSLQVFVPQFCQHLSAEDQLRVWQHFLVKPKSFDDGLELERNIASAILSDLQQEEDDRLAKCVFKSMPDICLKFPLFDIKSDRFLHSIDWWTKPEAVLRIDKLLTKTGSASLFEHVSHLFPSAISDLIQSMPEKFISSPLGWFITSGHCLTGSSLAKFGQSVVPEIAHRWKSNEFSTGDDELLKRLIRNRLMDRDQLKLFANCWPEEMSHRLVILEILAVYNRLGGKLVDLESFLTQPDVKELEVAKSILIGLTEALTANFKAETEKSFARPIKGLNPDQFILTDIGMILFANCDIDAKLLSNFLQSTSNFERVSIRYSKYLVSALQKLTHQTRRHDLQMILVLTLILARQDSDEITDEFREWTKNCANRFYLGTLQTTDQLLVKLVITAEGDKFDWHSNYLVDGMKTKFWLMVDNEEFRARSLPMMQRNLCRNDPKVFKLVNSMCHLTVSTGRKIQFLDTVKNCLDPRTTIFALLGMMTDIERQKRPRYMIKSVCVFGFPAVAMSLLSVQDPVIRLAACAVLRHLTDIVTLVKVPLVTTLWARSVRQENYNRLENYNHCLQIYNHCLEKYKHCLEKYKHCLEKYNRAHRLKNVIIGYISIINHLENYIQRLQKYDHSLLRKL